MVRVKAKGWALSKTLWLGVASVMLAVAEALTVDPLIAKHYPQVLGVIGILVIVLRVLTTQPLMSQPTGTGERNVEEAEL
jgi:hypothetical protein